MSEGKHAAAAYDVGRTGTIAMFGSAHTSLPSTSDGTIVFDTGTPPPGFSLQAELGYEPSPDGQRFLTVVSVSEWSPISVILNWKPPGR